MILLSMVDGQANPKMLFKVISSNNEAANILIAKMSKEIKKNLFEVEGDDFIN